MMTKGYPEKQPPGVQPSPGVQPRKKAKQRYFEERGLQLSIAVLTVLTLFAGISLQAVSAAVVKHYDLSFYAFSIFLIAGYAVIVLIISTFFTYRLVGPFKRLEYEMKLILKGDSSRRLSSRTQDDLHVRAFIKHVNELISHFEKMSGDYDKLSGAASSKLAGINEDLSKESFDCEKVKKEIKALQKEIHGLRGKQ